MIGIDLVISDCNLSSLTLNLSKRTIAGNLIFKNITLAGINAEGITIHGDLEFSQVKIGDLANINTNVATIARGLQCRDNKPCEWQPNKFTNDAERDLIEKLNALLLPVTSDSDKTMVNYIYFPHSKVNGRVLISEVKAKNIILDRLKSAGNLDILQSDIGLIQNNNSDIRGVYISSSKVGVINLSGGKLGNGIGIVASSTIGHIQAGLIDIGNDVGIHASNVGLLDVVGAKIAGQANFSSKTRILRLAASQLSVREFNTGDEGQERFFAACTVDLRDMKLSGNGNIGGLLLDGLDFSGAVIGGNFRLERLARETSPQVNSPEINAGDKLCPMLTESWKANDIGTWTGDIRATNATVSGLLSLDNSAIGTFSFVNSSVGRQLQLLSTQADNIYLNQSRLGAVVDAEMIGAPRPDVVWTSAKRIDFRDLVVESQSQSMAGNPNFEDRKPAYWDQILSTKQREFSVAPYFMIAKLMDGGKGDADADELRKEGRWAEWSRLPFGIEKVLGFLSGAVVGFGYQPSKLVFGYLLLLAITIFAFHRIEAPRQLMPSKTPQGSKLNRSSIPGTRLGWSIWYVLQQSFTFLKVDERYDSVQITNSSVYYMLMFMKFALVLAGITLGAELTGLLTAAR